MKFPTVKFFAATFVAFFFVYGVMSFVSDYTKKIEQKPTTNVERPVTTITASSFDGKRLSF